MKTFFRSMDLRNKEAMIALSGGARTIPHDEQLESGCVLCQLREDSSAGSDA